MNPGEDGAGECDNSDDMENSFTVLRYWPVEDGRDEYDDESAEDADDSAGD